MSKYEKISEIQATMDGFIYQEFVLILAIVMFVSGIFTMIVFTDPKRSSMLGIFSTVVLFSSAIIFYNVLTNYFELYDELEKAELDIVMNISETTTITTTKIAASRPTSEKYCPHVHLKENELCTYVELVSEGKTLQVFVPLESGVHADSENPLKVEYFKLTKEDRDFLNKYMKGIDSSFYSEFGIYPKLWSLGVLINN